MLRVSNGAIRISTSSDDRWGIPTKYWSVNSWGWVDLEKFQKLTYYESMPSDSERILWTLSDSIKHRLNALQSQNCIFQFNAIRSFRKNSYIRMTAILCNQDETSKIQYIPWFSAYIKYPSYNIICKIMNKIIYFRVKI